jgi:hypothetical protein
MKLEFILKDSNIKGVKGCEYKLEINYFGGVAIFRDSELMSANNINTFIQNLKIELKKLENFAKCIAEENGQ